MVPKFGTSGLRGLVDKLTEELVGDYIRAFIGACKCQGTLFVGHDLRPSSPRISANVIAAARAEGLAVIDCGATPTPALALIAMKANASAVMVTGSHIPADRNGLKFYLPKGEISKPDEQAISAKLGQPPKGETMGHLTVGDAQTPFEARYVSAFEEGSLSGLRIGVYQHSAVARDVMVNVIRTLGADVLPLGRSDTFIPVDTEAVEPTSKKMLERWCHDHHLDAIISTDGDSDRPMVTDHKGEIIAGDVLGVLTAQYLGADVICTPVSTNSMVTQLPEFKKVMLTKIGSPYVIKAMENALADDPNAKVLGFEANGGLLLGFDAQTQHGALSPLMTRDSILPILAPLVLAKMRGQNLSALVDTLPSVSTAAGRLQGVAPQNSRAFVERLTEDITYRTEFLATDDTDYRIDTTDGLRILFNNGNVAHIRPSGNAPELRCYVEASTRQKAALLVEYYLTQIRKQLS